MTPHTPCAEARQAAMDAADAAIEHGCGLCGAVDEALTAAFPIIRRQIIAECVGSDSPTDAKGVTVYPEHVQALAREVNELLDKGNCPHSEDCECVGWVGDGVVWAMLQRSFRALLGDATTREGGDR